MKKPMSLNLPGAVFAHNAAFLLLFFTAPKFYISGDLGLRLEDLMYPLTALLFAAAVPRIKNRGMERFNRVVCAYFAYILVQGLILSPFTGGFKYFVPIVFKQAQYFMVFYLLLYSFGNPAAGEKTVKLVSLLVSATLAWATLQVILSRPAFYSKGIGYVRQSYGIGAIGETFPHQAAAIFFFCFLFTYYFRGLKHRLFLLPLSAAAVFMTGSRTTIIALAVCAAYILVSSRPFRQALKKPAAVSILLGALLLGGVAADRALRALDAEWYSFLKRRAFTAESFRCGAGQRLERWEEDLNNPRYRVYARINFLTGMGRGYDNVMRGQWKLAADSGYLRDFMEIGLIGLFLHLLVYFRAGEYAGFRRYAAAFIPFLSLSVTTEVFLLSRSGMLILLFAALLIKTKDRGPAPGRTP